MTNLLVACFIFVVNDSILFVIFFSVRLVVVAEIQSARGVSPNQHFRSTLLAGHMYLP